MIGAALLFVLPTGFFLTHEVVTPYYQFPTVEITVFALAAAVAMMGTKAQLETPWDKLLAGAIFLGAAVHATVALVPPKNIFAPGGAPVRSLAVPEGMGKESWVFAGRYSGTLWWAKGIYAMDVARTDAKSRAVIVQYVAATKEPVFVVDDRPSADKPPKKERDLETAHEKDPPMARELMALGMKKKRAGDFEGAEVYRLAW